jgi:hypothetical protein
MIIYTANKNEIKELDITNIVSTQSIVYINDIIFDDVQLADGSEKYPNLRVLELDLKNGDIVSAKDNKLITYKIK